MKCAIKLTGTFFLFFLLNLSSCVITETAYPQTASVSVQVFYDALSPYGRWVDFPPYGYCWIPVGYSDFYPYVSGGYWGYTMHGWTWISYYSWGWAPFHYGRWFFDAMYGWIWIPGNDWGPAWVVWASSPGYYGWIPMMPGYGYHIHNYPEPYWTFVSTHDFGKSEIHYGPRTNNSAIIKRGQTIENQHVDQARNSTYYAGPQKEEIQRVTGREIKTIPINESSKPDQRLRNDQLIIYRPRVENKSESGKKPAPARITKIEDTKQREKKEAKPEEKITVPRDKTDVIREKPAIKEFEKPIQKHEFERQPPKPSEERKEEPKQRVNPQPTPPIHQQPEKRDRQQEPQPPPKPADQRARPSPAPGQKQEPKPQQHRKPELKSGKQKNQEMK